VELDDEELVVEELELVVEDELELVVEEDEPSS